MLSLSVQKGGLPSLLVLMLMRGSVFRSRFSRVDLNSLQALIHNSTCSKYSKISDIKVLI